MRKTMRLLALVAALAMTLGVMAIPASAGTGTAAFEGFADVGKEKREDCTKQAVDGRPTGHGIGAPVITDDKEGWKDPDVRFAFWRFFNPNPGAIAVESMDIVSTNDGIVTDLNFDFCGWLDTVPNGGNGIGPACGMSSGRDGQGKIWSDDEDIVYKLSNIEWAATVGGTLPITAEIHELDNRTDKTKSKGGMLVGVVQAQGGAACAEEDKAQQFTVIGTAEWSDEGDLVDDEKEESKKSHPNG